MGSLAKGIKVAGNVVEEVAGLPLPTKGLSALAEEGLGPAERVITCSLFKAPVLFSDFFAFHVNIHFGRAERQHTWGEG